MLTAVTKLDRALRKAGIPIYGVGSPAPGEYRIDFQPSATPAQIAAANALIGTTDLADKTPRTIAEITTDLMALNAADTRTVLFGLAALMVQQNPNFLIDLGIPISGEK